MHRFPGRRIVPLGLFLLLMMSGAPGNAKTPEPPSPADQAYADLVMVDGFLSVLTGGMQGLPQMDSVHLGKIVQELLTGQTEQAAKHAAEFLLSQGVALAGSSAVAAVAAVNLGKTLGLQAHELFGAGKLDALYKNLAQNTPRESWPRSYEAALKDDFIAAHLDTHLHVVANWLKARDQAAGGLWGTKTPVMSDAYYARKAYQALVARRDFELGCDRLGLKGADRTPEELQEALERELERAATEARTARDRVLMELWIARQFADAKEAERKAREERDAKERARLEEEARAAAAAAEAMKAELEKRLEATTEVPPAPAAPTTGGGSWLFSLEADAPSATGGLQIDVRADQTGPDTTVFHATVTNRGPHAIEAFQPRVQPFEAPQSGGVAWSNGDGPRTLRVGEQIRLTFTAVGDVGGAALYLLGDGEVLASRLLPVEHVAASPAPPDLPSWLEPPATYRGVLTHRWTARAAEGASLETTYQTEQTAVLGEDGLWTVTTRPHRSRGCGLAPVVEQLPDGGTRLVGYQLQRLPERDAAEKVHQQPFSLEEGGWPRAPLPADSARSRQRWTRFENAIDADRVRVAQTFLSTFPGNPKVDPPRPEWSLEIRTDGRLERVQGAQ